MRQWPCGANVRSRLPLGRQPLISDMLVLIQVSSMEQNKTDLGTAVAQKNTETLWD